MRLNKKRAVQRFLAPPVPVPKENKEWALLEECYEISQACKESFVQRWVVCLAFLAGKQYTFFNSNANILQQINKVKGRRRYVDNKLMPHFKRQVADLTRSNPEMSVVPNTTDDADIRAAKIGDSVLKGFWHQDDMKSKTRGIANWIYSCGNAFLDDVWDPRRGPMQVNPQTGAVEYLGDVTCTLWSPFEIGVPAIGMNNTELNRMPWVIKSRWFTLEWIRNNFPRRGKDVAGETMPKLFTDVGMLTQGHMGVAFQKVPGALVHWFYLQPNSEYKRGLFAVGANSVILDRADYPFDFYHLEHFKDIEIPGSFWGKATLEDAVPLQVRWNNTVNDIDEFNRTMAKGKMLEPRNARVEILPDDAHGQRIVYKPVLGHKPEMMDMKNAPSSLKDILIITRESINDLFAHHEVTQGTNKSDIRSGEMVSLLHEQDSFANVPSHTLFEERLESSMSRVLRRVQKGYSRERTVKWMGEAGEWNVLAFKGADLRDNSDVKVKRQSTLPDSRVFREASILKRYEAGLYGDPRDPEVRRHVMNMLDDAVIKDIYSDTRLDENNARFENELLVQLEMGSIPVNSYDNHSVHMKEHNHFRKSGEYQRLRYQNPEIFIMIETKFIEHTDRHQKFIDLQIRSMIMQQMLLGGGTKGGESQNGQKGSSPKRNLESSGSSSGRAQRSMGSA